VKDSAHFEKSRLPKYGFVEPLFRVAQYLFCDNVLWCLWAGDFDQIELDEILTTVRHPLIDVRLTPTSGAKADILISTPRATLRHMHRSKNPTR
jgi:hypothetical protein